MINKLQTVFSPRLLFVTNIFLIVFLVVILIKEDYPIRFLNKFKQADGDVIKNAKVVSKEELSQFNNTFHPIFTDYRKGSGVKEYKVLILGNSLASHSKADNIGWTHESGMAATSINNDYVHLLLAKLSDKLPNEKIAMRVANFAEFERSPTTLLHDKIDSFTNFKPDLVIFQLGENVSEEDVILFQDKYITLINAFKKLDQTSTICTTPFFPSLRKNKMVESVALETNSFLVDLSRLTLLDNENLAIKESDYQGDKTQWKVDGIGMHPGDKGMKNIADQLFLTINALFSINEIKSN